MVAVANRGMDVVVNGGWKLRGMRAYMEWQMVDRSSGIVVVKNGG